MIFSKETEPRATPFLPLLGRLAQRSGSRTSAFVLLLLGPLASAQAAGPVDAQIAAAVDVQLQQQLQAEGAERDWQAPRLSHEITDLGGSGERQLCSQPLQVQAEADASLGRRQRLVVQCPGDTGWSANLLVQSEVWLPVWTASRVIERGEAVDAERVSRQEQPLSRLTRGYFQDADEVLGQRARRRIREGQSLSPALLAPALLVERGQRVTVVARHDGIEARTEGEVLDDGSRGEQVRVRNLSSERVIKAKVLRKGVVTSTF